MGGVGIQSERDIERYAEVAKVEGVELQTGKMLRLDPCVPAHYLNWYVERKGRPCPRVDATQENATLMQVLFLDLNEMTRQHSPAMLDACFPFADPDERAALIRRLTRAIASDVVHDWLHPDRKRGD